LQQFYLLFFPYFLFLNFLPLYQGINYPTKWRNFDHAKGVE
jgi:hypothetical protein